MSLSFLLLVSEMGFIELCPSHFLITFWYLGAHNDSFWDVRVVKCRVFNNKISYPCSCDPHSSVKWFWENRWLGIHCHVKREHWFGSGWWSHSAMSWLSNLGRSLYLSSFCKMKHQMKLSEAFPALTAFCPCFGNHFGVDWDVLCLICSWCQLNTDRLDPILPGCHVFCVALFWFSAHSF